MLLHCLKLSHNFQHVACQLPLCAQLRVDLAWVYAKQALSKGPVETSLTGLAAIALLKTYSLATSCYTYTH